MTPQTQDLGGEDMQKRRQALLTGVRLPREVLKRLDAMAALLDADPAVGAMGPVSRSAVLRLALVRGLDALEAEHKSRRRG